MFSRKNQSVKEYKYNDRPIKRLGFDSFSTSSSHATIHLERKKKSNLIDNFKSFRQRRNKWFYNTYEHKINEVIEPYLVEPLAVILTSCRLRVVTIHVYVAL